METEIRFEKEICSMKKIEDSNYRSLTFIHDNIKYDIGISLYCNAIFIIITTNGKIGNLYSLDISTEKAIDTVNQSLEDKELETSECLLGNRSDERSKFISNFLLSSLASKIALKSSKINKLLISLTLPSNNHEFELNEANKQIITILKEKLLILFDI